MTISEKRAEKCITHHHACDCREYRYQEMETALQIIHTWASFDMEGKHPAMPTLKANQVVKLCNKALGKTDE